MDQESRHARTAQLDRATAERLARLHDQPLPEAGFREALDARLSAELTYAHAQAAEAEARRLAQASAARWSLGHWWGSLVNAWPPALGRLMRSRTLAASLLIAASVTALLLFSGDEPAHAAPQQLLAMHQHMQRGQGGPHLSVVASAAAADAALRERWAALPRIPEPLDMHSRVLACCLHRLDHQQVACVALEVDGVGVTMAVAEDLAGALPAGRVHQRSGLTHYVQIQGGTRMVLTELRQGWVCLMGALPAERLMELAASLND